MRAFVLGLLVLVLLSLTVLSIRPGGLRRQLRQVGRRFRLVLLLGGVYVVVSTVIRVFFTAGFVADYGPAMAAIVLGAVFVVLAQDPALPPAQKP
jgi:hypothetical protein